MSRRLFLIVTLSLFGTGTLFSPSIARAETPLTRATVQALRNQVQLILKNRVTRAAQTADTMTPGDSLATARKSFAELRFNDNSLARIGERTLFQFVPNTRNFYLGNGTALLLIPPGQGRTNVRTPNAAAGIRGSALFVRYNEDTNTTIVGALTNSRIEVSNGETPQAQTLKAGQMAVIIQNQVVQVYNFDLNTFYQTSELVRDLDLPLRNALPSADPGIAAVQAETAQAVREQAPLTGQIFENPAFVSLNTPPTLQAAIMPGYANQITLTPSGFDLSTARQAIIANPSAQAFTASATGVQTSMMTPQAQLSIPRPESINASVATQVTPITLTAPTVNLGTGITNAAPMAPSLATPPTVPAATPPTAAASPTQSIPSSGALPTTPSVSATIAPPAVAPAASVTSPPSQAVTVQPTPTPVTTPVSTSPTARPDPVATPSVQAAPTPTSSAADTSAVVQTTIVTTPATVAPTSTTVVQTGTSVQVQTGTTAITGTTATTGTTVTTGTTTPVKN